MDTLTHAVTGALLVRATSGKQKSGQPAVRCRMLAGAAAAVFPDVDFALRLVDTLTYLNWHQGPTHSLLLPLWGLLLAWLCARAGRGRYRWQAFYIPVCLGLAIHIAGDALTAYGPMLLSPFSGQRYFVPWLYLFDPVFSVIAVTGLFSILLLPHGRAAAVITLALLIVYVGWQMALHRQALAIGASHVKTRALVDAEVHALPQPPGPFHWKVLVSGPDGYDEAWVDLYPGRRATPDSEAGLLRRMSAAHDPVSEISWRHHWQFGSSALDTALARAAWQDDALAPFRRFALFPVLDHIERKGNGVCVWFVDLRFTLPVFPPSYRFGACRNNAADDWRLERLRGAFWID
ncbi:MAG: metal-dependent hydrolase [Gammaproteobacteria bacterium]|nr:metal-dependent hydrolase [Gammaproteobacteria bacterium]